ncbi:hypothetical protein [Streptomyces sp. NPDC089919]|uniref:hypothetical protein n=1 Tax=Streptomyces sp. NPDC089919 TaxID=3155188 RepID=UPI00343DBF6D
MSELVPVAGEDDVYAMLDALGVLSAPASRIKTLRRAVREFLGHDPDPRPSAFTMYPRRPEHAVLRIHGGWERAGGAWRSEDDYDGPDRIVRPVGYLAQLLIKQSDCKLPQCEMGVHLDTGAECRACGYLEAERIGLAISKRMAAEAGAEQQRLAVEAQERVAKEIVAVYDQAVAENEQRDRVRAAASARAEEKARAAEALRQECPELTAFDWPECQGTDVPAPRDGELEPLRAAGRGRQAAEEQRLRAVLVAEGLRGTELEAEVRIRMAVWKEGRRQRAEAAVAADIAVKAARPVGAWPAVDHDRPQAPTAPF